jgi:hypothetical protein
MNLNGQVNVIKNPSQGRRRAVRLAEAGLKHRKHITSCSKSNLSMTLDSTTKE